MNEPIELNKPIFIISLDFELMWGVFDKRTVETYGDNILGVHKAIPEMLKLFSSYGINATWATVGFLFNREKRQLLKNLPGTKPHYTNEKFSSYNYLSKALIGENEAEDPYHFAYSLLQAIKNTQGQEIATHSYSHYYCLENGQDKAAFECDLKMACKLAKEENISICSIVLPRNQINDTYLEICYSNGIKVYRGNESNFLQKARNQNQLNLFIRFLRLLDSFINITGPNCFKLIKSNTFPINIRASAFLRPYSKKFKILEPFKLRRIKKSMTDAAKRGQGYHLWWHPHNFGTNISENLANLENILKHFVYLKNKYGLESCSMKEAGERLYAN